MNNVFTLAGGMKILKGNFVMVDAMAVGLIREWLCVRLGYRLMEDTKEFVF